MIQKSLKLYISEEGKIYREKSIREILVMNELEHPCICKLFASTIFMKKKKKKSVKYSEKLKKSKIKDT